MRILMIKYVGYGAALIAILLLAGCADGPEASLSNHPEVSGKLQHIGVISDLGGRIIYNTSRSLNSESTSGDISVWDIDDYVARSVQRQLIAGKIVTAARVQPGIFDDLSNTHMGRQHLQNLGCIVVFGLMSNPGLAQNMCNEFNPELDAGHDDAPAVQSRVTYVLSQLPAGNDLWLIFRKADGEAHTSDQSLLGNLSGKRSLVRRGIAIAQSGRRAMLQVLGRVTVVDGKTMRAVADVPLTMRVRPDSDTITPVWILKEEYAVDAWNNYTAVQREAVHATLNQLLDSAVAETLGELKLSAIPLPEKPYAATPDGIAAPEVETAPTAIPASPQPAAPPIPASSSPSGVATNVVAPSTPPVDIGIPADTQAMINQMTVAH